MTFGLQCVTVSASVRDIRQQRDGIALMRRGEGAVDGIIIAGVAGAAAPHRHAGPEGRAALGTLAVRVDVVRMLLDPHAGQFGSFSRLVSA